MPHLFVSHPEVSLGSFFFDFGIYPFFPSQIHPVYPAVFCITLLWNSSPVKVRSEFCPFPIQHLLLVTLMCRLSLYRQFLSSTFLHRFQFFSPPSSLPFRLFFSRHLCSATLVTRKKDFFFFPFTPWKSLCLPISHLRRLFSSSITLLSPPLFSFF